MAQGIVVALRIALALGGGYAVSAGLAALAAVALPAATLLLRSDAVVLASMLAFPIYLAVLIWAFAERRIGRLCIILLTAAIVSWAGELGLARLAGGT